MDTSLPPPVRLYQLATGHYVSQAIYVAATLGIADRLATGPQRHDDLARATAVAATCDFAPVRAVVDVGGGDGALLTGILGQSPALRGTVFDLPRVADGARRRIAAAGLGDRCEFVAGDFFQAVPAGGDAYILKHVIHDWDDRRARGILENCRRAMGSHGKLLIVEGVYPPRIDQSAPGRGAAANDVNMMVCTGGRQRSEAEFRQLFEDAGFTLTRIVPTPAMSSIIEGVP